MPEAREGWVAFLDSDDFWDENHLELLLKHVQGLPEAYRSWGIPVVVPEGMKSWELISRIDAAFPFRVGF